MRVQTQFPVSILSGHDGYADGQVYYKWRNLQVSHKYFEPTYTNTSDQNLVRSRLTAASQAFSEISDADRATWIAYAQAHPRTYIGTKYALPEQVAFVGHQFLRKLYGLGYATVAPTTTTPWTISNVSSLKYFVEYDQIIFEFTTNHTGSWPQYILLRITPALGSKQRHPRKCDFRLAKGISANSMISFGPNPADIQVTDPRFTYDHLDWVGFEMVPVNPQFVRGTPHTGHKQIVFVYP